MSISEVVSRGEKQMTISNAFVQELEQEARTTRRVLERVPDAHLAWKPHEKSWSLGQLALHIATVPRDHVTHIAGQQVISFVLDVEHVDAGARQ